ncbi:MAG: serine protease [Parerythrobacter sp.]
MFRPFLLFLVTLFGLIGTMTAHADPADIDAAARGVVRVVVVAENEDGVFPISHGSGFAVTGKRVVTNNHVVREAAANPSLRLAVVPSGGGEPSLARIIAVSARNDLALLEITENLRLPPLTLSVRSDLDSGAASAVGYPMNVDKAQGLEIGDIFTSQPPVKSRGFLSGTRPARQFDSVLHTAPIARGNSGGPLLDECGRVLGVNSFGATSDGSDAEFFFAVSMRELVPFLKANDTPAQTSALPCRSLADLDAEERARAERVAAAGRAEVAGQAEERRARLQRAQLEAELAVQSERENALLGAIALLLVAAGGAAVAWQGHQRAAGGERLTIIGGTVGVVALVAAGALWFSRPGLDAIDRRVAAAMSDPNGDASGALTVDGAMALQCTLDVERSRITGAPQQALNFDWTEDGCVNGRTQYGFASGSWRRAFVPNEEDAVIVAQFDPKTRTYRTDRYLLTRTAMDAARTARATYRAPSCGAQGASVKLGDLQGSVLSRLPAAPNERLVYDCEPKGG